MARFLILESSSSGSESGSLDNYTVNNDLSDVYEVTGDRDDALEKLAQVSNDYSNYNHMLVEVIPVTILRGEDNYDRIVKSYGDVRVSAERR